MNAKEKSSSCDLGEKGRISQSTQGNRHVRDRGSTHSSTDSRNGSLEKALRRKLKNSWHSMISRCLNPNHKSYHRYGGRGISIHQSWFTFEKFLYDVGLPPGLGRGWSIDRIDNDGNYEPGNVRWATVEQQQVNKKFVKFVGLNGQFNTMAGWARNLGIGQSGLSARLSKGWDLETALTTPALSKKESVRRMQLAREPMAAEISRKGIKAMKAFWASKTPEDRSKLARHAANSLWAQVRSRKISK